MYRKATVPLDGSKLAESVLPHVRLFVKQFNLSDVTFVRVVEREEKWFVASSAEVKALARLEATRRSLAEDYLTKIVNQLNYGGKRFHTDVIVGRMPEALIDFIKRDNTDLVLMATHGLSTLTRWFRGNVAENLFRSLKVPVFVVRAPTAHRDLDAKTFNLWDTDTFWRLFD